MRNKLTELLEIQDIKRLAREMIYLELLVIYLFIFFKFIVRIFS